MGQVAEAARETERTIAGIATTAAMNTPEGRAAIAEADTATSEKTGVELNDLLGARGVLAEGGLDFKTQNAVMEVIAETVQATGSTPTVIAELVRSMIQENLGVAPEDVRAGLDRAAKGGNEGGFELADMAQHFPSLASNYQASGRTGLSAVEELVAMLQVARKGTGSSSEAATNAGEWFTKIFAPDATKNFKDEHGINLAAIKRRADERGSSFAIDMVAEVQRLTGGDVFKIKELFGDKQAGLFLLPMIQHAQEFQRIMQEVADRSEGTLRDQYDANADIAAQKEDRYEAAMASVGRDAGTVWEGLTRPLKNLMLEMVDPDLAAAARTAEQQRTAAREEAAKRADLDATIASTQSRLAAARSDVETYVEPLDGNALQPGDANLFRQRVAELEAELQRWTDERIAILANDIVPGETRVSRPDGPVSVPTFRPDSDQRIPVPQSRPGSQIAPANVDPGRFDLGRDIEGGLKADTSQVAQTAMGDYLTRMQAMGPALVAEARKIAQAIQRELNVTATATVNIRRAGASVGAAGANAVSGTRASSLSDTGMPQ